MAGCHALEKRRISWPCGESKNDICIVQPVVWSLYRLWHSGLSHGDDGRTDAVNVWL